MVKVRVKIIDFFLTCILSCRLGLYGPFWHLFGVLGNFFLFRWCLIYSILFYFLVGMDD